MILIQFDALGIVPTAILEIVLIMIGAAFVGWVLARLIMNARIKTLHETIEERRLELQACRTEIQRTAPSFRPVVGNASRTVFAGAETVSTDPDDLKIIEGIGPKIEELLNREGIFTYSALAMTSPIRISSILKTAGPRFQIQDPTTWPKQAGLAKAAQWEELDALKKRLISGRTSD
jgi:predicted flap endonuclease-1-like 5' DNA nuclease